MIDERELQEIEVQLKNEPPKGWLIGVVKRLIFVIRKLKSDVN